MRCEALPGRDLDPVSVCNDFRADWRAGDSLADERHKATETNHASLAGQAFEPNAARAPVDSPPTGLLSLPPCSTAPPNPRSAMHALILLIAPRDGGRVLVAASCY